MTRAYHDGCESETCADVELTNAGLARGYCFAM